MTMLACQYNQPKRPGDLDLLTSKVVSESRGLPRPTCSRLRPDVRDRQTSVSIIASVYIRGGGIITITFYSAVSRDTVPREVIRWAMRGASSARLTC